MALTRILPVDDNEMFVETSEFILTSAACEVETHADVSRAVAQSRSFPPDLIFMDIQMPVMDGIESTRRPKADPATKHIVIVAFTAYAIWSSRKPLAGGLSLTSVRRAVGRQGLQGCLHRSKAMHRVGALESCQSTLSNLPATAPMLPTPMRLAKFRHIMRNQN